MNPFKYTYPGGRVHEQDILELNPPLMWKSDLIVTSPPYNVGIEYSSTDDTMDEVDYETFMYDWVDKCYHISREGGRMCVNIPLDTTVDHRPAYAYFVAVAEDVGWRYRCTIIWDKKNVSQRTAWGSWLSASAPHVMSGVECIAVFYRDKWRRERRERFDGKRCKNSTITKEEFIAWTDGVWRFPGSSHGAGGHPAPFPLELPMRCIKLFSFKEDTVFDPFCGSGTTLVAALKTGRRAVGFDIDRGYCEIARTRLRRAGSEQKCLF